MKKITLILSVIFFAFVMQVNAQICSPACTPDVSCVDVINPGEICPEILPTANVGTFYDETVTVIPPATFMFSGVEGDVTRIRIDEVLGLPDGMTWCKSQEDFNVTDPYTRYCCQLSGTPTVPGEYQLTLKITPWIFFFTEMQQAQQTDDTSLMIIVLPAAPVAAFTSNLTATTTGTPVSFTDESTGTPTSWAWVFEGGTPATSTEQNPVVTWATAGQYDVTLAVTNDGGGDDSYMDNYMTITTGVNINTALFESVKVYPNPATSQITVEAENLQSITVGDMLGKVVFVKETNNSKEVIDISSLRKANYFVKVSTANGEVTKNISIK